MWSDLTDIVIIYVASALGLLWAFVNALHITNTKLTYSSEDEDEETGLLLPKEKLDLMESIGEKIALGANSFLFKEYSIMTVFIILFGIVVLLIVDLWGQEHFHFRCYATVSFVVGSFTSILCGYIGMRIAVVTNYRTTFKAT